ncbi:MAG TPA: ATP-binding protein [Candidatus Lumbricidophila sp.]|nr:ATP-binding protein [Candidatus Lumbricidophila sp.]
MRPDTMSLRLKVALVTMFMLLCGVLVSGLGSAAMLRAYSEEQLNARLATIASGDVTRYFADSPTVDAADHGVLAALSPTLTTEDVYIAKYSPAGELVATNWSQRPIRDSPLAPAHIDPASVPTDADPRLREFSLADGAGHTAFRAIVHLDRAAAGGPSPILIAISTDVTNRLLATYLTIYFGLGVGVSLVGALATRVIVTRTFAPLRRVEHTAAAIANGDLSQRLYVAAPNTEVGRLNRSINSMLDRVDNALHDRARTIEQMRRFVGDASHELRTPLVSVRGYAELYRMGALQTPDEVAQAMRRIEKEAIRMGGLVEDLLALARLDEARPLGTAPVDLMMIARDAALDAMAAHPDRDLELLTGDDATATIQPGSDASDTPPAAPVRATMWPVPPKNERRDKWRRRVTAVMRPALGRQRDAKSTTEPLPPAAVAGNLSSVHTGRAGGVAGAAPASGELIVLGDENKLRQVVANLISNAIRFTNEGSPIELRVVAHTEAGVAVLDVIDHGDGIPPQIREKIFERFWRADTSRARETGGSGLGLAIVASIVQAHGGSVAAIETPGGGATFRVTLPLSRV